MQHRSYQGAADVALLQAFNAAAFAQTNGCGYLHPGDIPHRLFNGNKYYDPAALLTIWEDAAGVAAWILVAPRSRSFDAQVRPAARGGALERAVLQFAEARTLALMQQYTIADKPLSSEAYQCDITRVGLLQELGWMKEDEPPWVLNRATLVDLPEPVLPAGYTIRAARGSEEAGALAAVHAAAFGSTWTPELYGQVMASPGYAAEREFVVEAADGTLAAFTVTWHDPLNRTGLFEPVGTHPHHQRRGLGKALLLTVMRQMAAAGLTHALVVNDGTNVASRNLYRACGFQPWYRLDNFTKPVAR
ncbi:MAG: GNAT family N-acetyltransferase [Caldilineaceae bacterium]|nr:GNAT family N-acetyltransferase [Caldilineaceae bacterium]